MEWIRCACILIFSKFLKPVQVGGDQWLLASLINQASQRSLILFRRLNQGHICKRTHCRFAKSAYEDLLVYFGAWMTADSSNERAATSPISNKVITLLVRSF